MQNWNKLTTETTETRDIQAFFLLLFLRPIYMHTITSPNPTKAPSKLSSKNPAAPTPNPHPHTTHATACSIIWKHGFIIAVAPPRSTTRRPGRAAAYNGLFGAIFSTVIFLLILLCGLQSERRHTAAKHCSPRRKPWRLVGHWLI